MKKIVISLLVACATRATGQITTPPDADNEKARVSQWIGPVEVTITYNSPNVHADDGTDRTGHIWGELVPYGFTDPGFGTAKSAPWRAGANENTTVYFSHDVKVEGKDLKAGTYGFFISVEKEGPWTIVFSKSNKSWGHFFYDAKDDALRVQVNAKDAEYTEWLTYGFENRLPNTATAFMQWEKKKLPFKIEVPNVNEIYFAEIKEDLRSAAGFDYRNWQSAAQLCVNYKMHLDEALAFAESAISLKFVGVEDFQTLKTKATVLEAMGKNDEAGKVMDKAIKHETAGVSDVHVYGKQLLKEGKSQRALEIFKLNRQLHPDDKFMTFVGLARGYAANNDKKNAIKNWEIAIKNLPEDQKTFLPQYEAELKKLKDS
ncbi:MAG TPA: DUF2911 domain-containing protein [Flavobacteriales bacterium]|nr:DUF2911 domain-containing protein [Flavobacteriales bacterium]